MVTTEVLAIGRKCCILYRIPQDNETCTNNSVQKYIKMITFWHVQQYWPMWIPGYQYDKIERTIWPP